MQRPPARLPLPRGPTRPCLAAGEQLDLRQGRVVGLDPWLDLSRHAGRTMRPMSEKLDESFCHPGRNRKMFGRVSASILHLMAQENVFGRSEGRLPVPLARLHGTIRIGVVVRQQNCLLNRAARVFRKELVDEWRHRFTAIRWV